MMLPWMKLETSFGASARVKDLREAMGCSRHEAMGILADLWLLTLAQAWRTFNLSKLGVAGIEEEMRWQGQAGALVAMLRKVGALDGPDGYDVHGLEERCRKFVNEALYWEKRRADTHRKAPAAAEDGPQGTFPPPMAQRSNNTPQPPNRMKKASDFLKERRERETSKGQPIPGA